MTSENKAAAGLEPSGGGEEGKAGSVSEDQNTTPAPADKSSRYAARRARGKSDPAPPAPKPVKAKPVRMERVSVAVAAASAEAQAAFEIIRAFSNEEFAIHEHLMLEDRKRRTLFGGKADDADPETLLMTYGDPRLSIKREWLFHELLIKCGVALLSGSWGAGKTFLLIAMAVALALGKPFAGRECKRKGVTLFLGYESAYEIEPRLHAAVVAELGDDPGPGKFPWFQVVEPPRLKDGFDKLLTLVDAAKKRAMDDFGLPLVLIAIDTFGRAGRLDDQNDGAENQVVMDRLADLAKHAGCMVVATDHFGKDTTKGTRGSLVKEDSADGVLAAVADNNGAGTITNRRLEVRKVKGVKTGEMIPWTLTEVGGEAVVVWSEADADTVVVGSAASPKQKRGDGIKCLLAAIRYVLAVQADCVTVGAENTPAAPQDAVRKRFMAKYIASSDTEEKRDDAKRRAWSTALADGSGQCIGGEVVDGESYLYLLPGAVLS